MINYESVPPCIWVQFEFLLFPFLQGFAEAKKIWKASSEKCYRAKNTTLFLVALSVLESFHWKMNPPLGFYKCYVIQVARNDKENQDFAE